MLSSGARLGPYEIVAALGAGGMGEVYRAKDAKLDREVPIKVLADSLAGDPASIVRFEREARTLAALNHPNIAHVYGLEQAGPLTALVMELVDGPTLADLIADHAAHDRRLPTDDVLGMARQMADAFE